MAVLLGVPLGILAAARHGSAVDTAAMTVALVGTSVPSFWLGLLLIIVFGVQLGWLPVSGYGTLTHLLMPAFVLGGFYAAQISRLTRTSLLEVLAQDFVRTAWAKGLAERAVLLKHVLRNAALPVMTVLGLDFGRMLGGAVVVETIFAWPGMGRLAVQAVLGRDFPVVQGAAIMGAAIFLAVNLIIDLLYGFVDPRLRASAAPRSRARAPRPSGSCGARPGRWGPSCWPCSSPPPSARPGSRPTTPPRRISAPRRVRPSLTPVRGHVHLLGTDQLGRDILSRLLVGLRISLLVALVVVPLSTLLGMAAGMVTGYRGGWLDLALMRLVDAQLAIPTLAPHGRRGGRAGLRAPADRDRPGHHGLDDLRARRAGRGAVPPRARLRGRGAGHGRVRLRASSPGTCFATCCRRSWCWPRSSCPW